LSELFVLTLGIFILYKYLKAELRNRLQK
jgi:hypothetical protein